MKISEYFKRYLYLLIFGIAMGLMEAIIVVYLRELFYPNGFAFPLRDIPLHLLYCEWIRELCTLIMLAAIALLSGKSFLLRFSFFIFSFGVWDIFYYVGLKWLLDWPASLLTWDLLFLIPVPWFSPVLAPLLCSIGMIALAIIVTWLRLKHQLTTINWMEWSLFLGGSFVIWLTFIEDVAGLILRRDLLNEYHPNNAVLKNWIAQYVPESFLWIPFVMGALAIVLGSIILIRRHLPQAEIKLKPQKTEAAQIDTPEKSVEDKAN